MKVTIVKPSPRKVVDLSDGAVFRLHNSSDVEFIRITTICDEILAYDLSRALTIKLAAESLVVQTGMASFQIVRPYS